MHVRTHPIDIQAVEAAQQLQDHRRATLIHGRSDKPLPLNLAGDRVQLRVQSHTAQPAWVVAKRRARRFSKVVERPVDQVDVVAVQRDAPHPEEGRADRPAPRSGTSHTAPGSTAMSCELTTPSSTATGLPDNSRI